MKSSNVSKEFDLIRRARDLREIYEASKPQLTAGVISLDEFMRRKKEWRQAELEMKKAVKKGTYSNIEKTLKEKYGKRISSPKSRR